MYARRVYLGANKILFVDKQLDERIRSVISLDDNVRSELISKQTRSYLYGVGLAIETAARQQDKTFMCLLPPPISEAGLKKCNGYERSVNFVILVSIDQTVHFPTNTLYYMDKDYSNSVEDAMDDEYVAEYADIITSEPVENDIDVDDDTDFNTIPDHDNQLDSFFERVVSECTARSKSCAMIMTNIERL